jgi:hypothetical protein
MKIASSAYNHPKLTSNRDVSAILPLVPIEDGDYMSDQTISHILRSTPADPDSPKYKIYVHILQGDEDCRTIIKWSSNVMKVLNGLNVTTHTPAKPIVETLLTGTPLSLFQQGITVAKTANMVLRARTAVAAGGGGAVAAGAAITTAGIDDAANLTMLQISYGLQHVVTQLLPRRVLARVKRYLRRECRKPREMKVRTYFQHVQRVNIDELPSLPPFAGNQSLSQDEVLDILLFGTPRSWQKEMERQGFDPMTGSVQDTLDFMERLEATDDFDGTTVKQSSKPQAKKGASGNPKKVPSSPGGKKGHCMIHGEGNHTSEECYTLQKEAKKLKSSYGTNTVKYADKAKSGSGNKTWNRKAEQGKSKTKSDLATFIGKEIAKGMKKQKKSDLEASKKRKNDSDDEGADLHVFDLEGFNYNEMDNLKIEDEASC